MVDQRSKTLHLKIEDRCTPTPTPSAPWRTFTLDTMSDQPVSFLKEAIVARIDPAHCEEGVRLRIEDETKGLCPPIHEDQTLKEAGMKQNLKVVLEKGTPPTSTQITICYHVSPISEDLDTREVH